jgi:fibronectin type 3 domain-containing protein
MRHPEFAPRPATAFRPGAAPRFGTAPRFRTALRSGLAWRGLATVTAGGLIILAGGTGTGGWAGPPGSIAPAAFVSSAPASQPAAVSSAPASQPAAETAPAAPAGVTTAAGDGQVTVSWLAPSSAGGSGATSYNVYESATSVFPGSKLQATVRGLDDTVTSLTNGTTYYFWVTASNGAGASSPSSTVSAAPAAPAAPVTAPGAPTGLQAIGGDSHVTLSWSAPASTGGSPVTGYRIYVGTTPAFGGTLPRMTSAGTSATVRQLPDGTTYYFAVAAVNAHGAGAMSPVATATTTAPAQPATSGPPTGLAARPDGSQVILSWSAPAGYPQPSGYLIYAGTRPGGELGTPVSKIPVRSTDCVVAGLTGGTRYYFEVTAVGAAGHQSARSGEASAVPVTASSGSGTDPGASVFPVEGQSGPASATQVAEMAQAPSSAGEPSWLIITLAAVAVAALAGALAVVVHLRRIGRYPGRLGSPSPRALQTVGPNGPDGRPQELLSGRPHRQ